MKLKKFEFQTKSRNRTTPVTTPRFFTFRRGTVAKQPSLTLCLTSWTRQRSNPVLRVFARRPFHSRCAYCDVTYDAIGKLESCEEDVCIDMGRFIHRQSSVKETFGNITPCFVF